MNKPVKLPEIKKDAFKKARESLGLSLQDLAQMSCYSVRQIEQIENGESSSFYGAQVKVTAAKKVAGLLKLSEENAFDFSEVVPTKKVETPKSDAPEVEKRVDTAPPELKSVSEKETEPTRSTPKKSAPAQKQKSSKLEALSSASVKAGNPQKKLMLILGIAAAVVFSVITGQAAVDMFYQGAKVRLSNTTAKTILLEPAEIVQPVTSTDSQFR